MLTNSSYNTSDAGREKSPMSDGDTLRRLSHAEHHRLRAALENGTVSKIVCPNCQCLCLPGELVCPECGVLFAAGAETREIDTNDEAYQAIKSWPIGKVFSEHAPILLEIDGRKLTLPDADYVVIGRLSGVPGDPRPDVNLNVFQADKMGVSRRHARITRQGDLVYVADLGSSNGTFLNERHLPPNINRLVRDGDELRLGQLKAILSF